MNRYLKNAFARYVFALLSVGLALGLTLVAWRLVRPPVAPLFLAAIVITSWFAGRGPAVVATLLSGLLIDYFFYSPVYQLSGSWDDVSRVAVFTIEGVTLAFLVVSRRRISDEVRESREQLRALSTHLQTLIEQERTRISREIHDELGRELTSLKFDVSWLRDRAAKANNEADREKLTTILKDIDLAIGSVRRIATELRPPVLDALGLTAAIEWQAKDFENRTGIRCILNGLAEDVPLNSDAATTVFRIFQESLTNVARHANASEVRVALERNNGRVSLKIEDNGKGIRAGAIQGSLGILGMQERVRLIDGELQIKNLDNRGTRVSLEIPLRPLPERPALATTS
jgi:signal transduction histidine kinase